MLLADNGSVLDTTRDQDAAERTPWHESDWAMAVAGAGGLLVIGLLVFAVFMTSHESTLPAQPEGTTTSTVILSTATRHTTTVATTTRSIPVTTSEPTAPAIVTPAPTAPSESTSAAATTTMSNPYATTTVANAGAV